MDALETALGRFHFASTSYCAYCTNRSPWGIGLGISRGGVQFHAVRQGRAFIRVQGRETVALETGDVVVLPHGDAHEVVDSPETRAIPAPELLAGIPRTSRWMVSLGKDGVVAVLICAGFASVPGSQYPLLTFLPRSVHLRGAQTSSLEPILVMAEREMRTPGRATEAVLARLAEILLVESVRAYVTTLQPGQGGWIDALNQPKVAEVIRAIHDDPARPWTVRTLAAEVGISRSLLALRFRALVGKPVLAYLRHIRMIAAASLLQDPHRRSVAEIAKTVGYDSEAAFCRAFTREMGCPPSQLRPNSSENRIGRSQHKAHVA